MVFRIILSVLIGKAIHSEGKAAEKHNKLDTFFREMLVKLASCLVQGVCGSAVQIE